MKVQLFNPPTGYYQGVHYRMNPPLGLPILASVLRGKGHTAEVVDLEALQVGPLSLRASFEKQKAVWPDVVGFTCLTSNARGVRESVQAIRKAGYSGRVVVGGPHATLLPKEVIKWKGVDAVVVGECEGNVEEVLTGTGILGGEPLAIEDIPAPDWKHHTPAPETYEGNLPDTGHPEGIVMFSRGCPHKCSFCGNPVFGHQPTRFRPVARILSDLVALKARGIRSLFVYDDELLGAPTPAMWLSEIAAGMQAMGFRWKCQGRCSRRYVSRDELERLHRAGLEAVMWGVESFSPRVLRAVRKGITPDDILHTLRRAKEAGVKNWVFTMIGNLSEGPEEIIETARGLKAAYEEGLIDYRQTTVATPVMGTEFYEVAKAGGWLAEQPEAGAKMATIYARTPWLSVEQIREAFHRFDGACPVGPRGAF